MRSLPHPFWILLLFLGRSLSAQQVEVPEIQVLRLTPAQSEAFRLDGILSEDFWQEVAAIDDFRQREPEEGIPATE